MASATPLDLSVIHAYRHLYRALLHSVQFSKPARYVVKDQLRNAFRHGDRAKLDLRRICRTLEFLRGATREKGLEHRILKSLVHTAYMRADDLKKRTLQTKETPAVHQLRKSSFIHYEMTIAMLNESMGLCLVP